MIKQKMDIIKFVIESYQELFNCDYQEALTDINNSNFVNTLSKNPQYVLYYDSEYWARRVRCEKEKNCEI